MTRSSPSVARVAAVLNFMADHPGQAFTLTDLVRALRISRATCHGLLAGLVDASYLFRSSDKHYLLGPALVAIGRNADSLLSPLQAAQPEMRALADEFDVVCSAVFREGDALIVRERAASRSHLGWATPRDARLPLRPAYAGLFLAWEPAGAAEAWAAGLDPAPTAAELATMDEAIAFSRAHAFHAVILGRDGTGPSPAEMTYGTPGGVTPITFAGPLERAKALAVRSVTAPVFGVDQGVSFALSLIGFGRALSGPEILAVGERLRAACDRVTAYIGGRKPRP